MEITDHYNGNVNVKRDGVDQTYTKHELSEYIKCSKDPAYFARNYIKIISLDEGLVPFNLYPYQEKMFDHFNANRFNIVLACRQSGKSISSVAYLLWYAVFKPEKTIAILANKRDTAQEMVSRVTLALENLPFFLQPGCKALNKRSIEFSNNSKIVSAATSGSSIRGLSINLLFLDEFAFVEQAQKFYTSTYPVISAGKNTKIIITSTANGIGNPFHKLWEGAVQKTNEYIPFEVNWWDVPGRDEEWKRQTISNTSQLQFDQEYGNCLESCSQITILIDSTVYEIRIGDLYDCIKSGETLGLPFDEEVRLKAIRWYNLEEKNQNVAINTQILTPSGFKPFKGVNRYWHDYGFRFVFDDSSTLCTALNHKFIVDGKVKFAKEVFVGDNLGKVVVERSICEGQYFYDPLNVDDKIYSHDKFLVSHNTFFGTGDTLIDAETLLSLRAKNPIEHSEGGKLLVYDKVQQHHDYIMTVDVSKGRGQDYSTFNIVDISVSPFKQVATYRNNRISPLLFPTVILKYANLYNEAYVIVEANDQGTLVCNGLYNDLEYENMHLESAIDSGKMGIEITRKSKRIGCSGFKDLLESGALEIIDEETIREISTFEAKGQSYEATDGNHDDLVMNFVLLGYYCTTNDFRENTDIDIKKLMYEDRINQIEQDVPLFGFVDDGIQEHLQEQSEAGDHWKTAEYKYSTGDQLLISDQMDW